MSDSVVVPLVISNNFTTLTFLLGEIYVGPT